MSPTARRPRNSLLLAFFPRPRAELPALQEGSHFFFFDGSLRDQAGSQSPQLGQVLPVLAQQLGNLLFESSTRRYAVHGAVLPSRWFPNLPLGDYASDSIAWPVRDHLDPHLDS